MDAHPEIISIIKKRDEIHYLIYNKEDYKPAIKQMIGIIRELETKDQDKNFLTEVVKEYAILENNRSITANRARMKRRQMIYTEWLGEINNILWKGTYLSNQKYGGGIDEDEIMKDGEDQFASVTV